MSRPSRSHLIELTVPAQDVAVSNGSIIAQSPAEDGARTIRFATTPPLPTYLLAFAVGKLRSTGVLTGGDAKHSIGMMTDARWKDIHDFGVRTGLMPDKPGWQAAYTLDYVKNLRVVA